MDYNNLNTVEAANDILKRSRFEISHAGEIIRKYGLGEKLMIILLHRHYELNENEVVVETVDGMDRISFPRNVKERNFFPSSFRFNEKGETIPHEYVEHQTAIELPSEFLEAIYKYLVKTKVDSVIGLGICYENDVNFGIEHTDAEARMNIVKGCKAKELNDDQLILTSWGFLSSDDVMLPAQACFPITGCLQIGGNHDKINKHF